jgi:hypothetical protein
MNLTIKGTSAWRLAGLPIESKAWPWVILHMDLRFIGPRIFGAEVARPDFI